jgi:hypothetical protein
MLIGVLLAITWLVLLVRYPARALPVSAVALLGLGLVAAWVLWQEHRGEQRLAHLELRLEYAPGHCPSHRPLHLVLTNGSDRPLQSLRWQIAAYRPDSDLNLAQNRGETPRYHAADHLQPGASWEDCLPVPPLRPGYRPESLDFQAQRLRGQFAD